MKKIYLKYITVFVMVCSAVSANAQLTGIKNIPGDYATLASAVSDLNTQGVGAGGVTLNVVAANPQTASAGGYVIGGAGSLVLTTSGMANPVTIQGNNNIVTASASQTVGSLTDAIFKLVGADYVTITGFNMQEDAANTVTTAASNTMTEMAVALFYVSLTDGSQNNTIQGNTISLNRTYQNSFGVYSNTRHSSTVITASAEVTSSTGANSFNKIYANTISNVNYGVVFIGAGSGLSIDIGNDIGGSSLATGNTITNWGGIGVGPSGYLSLTGNNYCIFINQQINDNVSFNTIVSAAGTSAGITMGGILKNYTAGQPLGTITTNINNNVVTVTTAPTTGGVVGINSQGLTSLSTATINMNNNQVLNCTITGSTATTASLTGITNLSGPGLLNMNNNIVRGFINSSSAVTTGAFTGISNSGAVVNTANFNTNAIGNASGSAYTLSGASTGAVTGIGSSGISATCALTMNNNNFQGFNYTVEAASSFKCINLTGAVLSETITNNNFNNITINSSASILGFLISATNTTPTVTITGNFVTTQFNNVTATGGANCIAVSCNGSATATGSSTLSNNNFSNITFRTTTSFGGVIYWLNGNVAGSTHNLTISNNTVANVINNGTATTASLYGLFAGFGNTNNISNNSFSGLAGTAQVIGLLTSNNSTNTAGVFNVNDNSIFNITSSSATSQAQGMQCAAGPTQNIFKNKIYDISASAAGTVIGLLQTNSTVGSTNAIYNNIIGKLSAPSSGFFQAVRAITFGTTVANTTNLYYNSVYLDGNNSGQSYCVYTPSLIPTYSFRNNIFINNSTPTAGLEQLVFYRDGVSDISTYSPASNNNILYAGTPGPLHLLYADGAVSALTNSQQTLAGLQAFASPRESNSQTELTPFLNTTTGASADYLHVNPAGGSLAESGAVNIAGITTDFDGDIRQGNAGYTGSGSSPDIGADEFGLALVPISIQYFRGSKQNGGNLIDWKVTCIGTPYLTLTLERSRDQRSFTAINNINATSLRCLSPFSYVDAAPLTGINYYRLKSVDADGKITYSNVVAIINKDKGFEIVNLAPNPVRDAASLNVSSATAARLEIIITDVNGKQLQKQTAQMVAGSNLVPLNTSKLAAGSYQVTLITQDGDKSTLRFVKQ